MIAENREFVKEFAQDKYGLPEITGSAAIEKFNPFEQNQVEAQKWEKYISRTGVIAKKIGNYPLWLKDGTKIRTTLLQVSI